MSDWAATLFVDASHCPETGAGGYGYRVASSRGKRNGSGILQGRITNSCVAEMKAVVNALWLIRNEAIIGPGDTVLVQTDSLYAIDALSGRRYLTSEEVHVRKEYSKVCNLMYVQLRHIRGHVNSDKPRFRAHARADELAREQMKLQRKNFERGSHAGFGFRDT